MSDGDRVLILVARHARDHLEALVPLVRTVRDACGLDTPPRLSVHYQGRSDTLALVVHGNLPGGPKGCARTLFGLWRGPLRLQAVAPPPEAVPGLLKAFEVAIPEVLDTVAAVATVQAAASSSSPDRRRARRFATGSLSAVVDGRGDHPCPVSDLSVGGCFVELADPLPAVGEVLTLTLSEQATDVRLEARVIFHLPASRAAAFDRTPGIGLHFVSVEPETEAALATLLARASATRGGAGAGRRLEQRLPVDLPARVEADGRVLDGRAVNLSSGGVYLAIEAPPSPGTLAQLHLEIPGEALPLTIAAEVRHVVPPGDPRGREPGCGLAFTNPTPESRARLAGHLAALARRGSARILVVDDTAFFRTVLTDLLAGAGYDVLQADSGEAALRILAEKILTLDLLILDLALPGMSGVELLDRLRHLGGETELPVMILSGTNPDAAARERMASLGTAGIHAKSEDPADLLQAVDRILAPADDEL